MEGIVTVTDKRGGILYSGSIWVVLLMGTFSGRWGVDPNKIRVYIDGNEIDEPEAFKETDKGG